MKSLKNYMKHSFGERYSEKGPLPVIDFPCSDKYGNRIIIVGSERGNLLSGTSAIINVAERLKHRTLENTNVIFVPVLDVKGYPDKSTVIGYEGMGRAKHLDESYFGIPLPDETKSLYSILTGKHFDLAVMLNSVFREDAPVLDGFFLTPQVSTIESGDRKIIHFPFHKARDLAGSLASAVCDAGYPILAGSDDGYLGDGHVLMQKGIVLPGVELDEGIEFRTRHGFARYCETKGIPSLIATSVSSRSGNSEASASHKVALEKLIEFYEGLAGQ